MQAGEAILNLEETDAPFEVTLFVPFAEGKKIQPGMEVRISPDTVRREEFGFMLGKVQSVSSQPVTSEEVVAKLGRDLAQKYVRDTPFEVKAVPEIDETTGRFKWTSGEGPPSEVLREDVLASAFDDPRVRTGRLEGRTFVWSEW